MTEVSAIDPKMLIWIDEIGSDRHSEIRKYGYSLRGAPAHTYPISAIGKHLSVIP